MNGLRVGAMRGWLEVWVEWLMLLSCTGGTEETLHRERLEVLRGY